MPTRPAAQLVLQVPHINPIRPENPQREFLDLLRTRMRRAEGEHRIVFMCQVVNNADFLRVEDVFVYPLRREGMPNVVPEVLARELISVLALFIGSPSEFGQPGREYNLAARIPGEIAGGLVRLLDCPQGDVNLEGKRERGLSRDSDSAPASIGTVSDTSIWYGDDGSLPRLRGTNRDV